MKEEVNEYYPDQETWNGIPFADINEKRQYFIIREALEDFYRHIATKIRYIDEITDYVVHRGGLEVPEIVEATVRLYLKANYLDKPEEDIDNPDNYLTEKFEMWWDGANQFEFIKRITT